LPVDSGNLCDFVNPGDSVRPLSSSLRPPMALARGAAHCASTVSSTTAKSADSESSSSPSGEGQGHIDSLLHSLPSDLSDEQRARAEAFIRSRVHVFSSSEYKQRGDRLPDVLYSTGGSGPARVWGHDKSEL